MLDECRFQMARVAVTAPNNARREPRDCQPCRRGGRHETPRAGLASAGPVQRVLPSRLAGSSGPIRSAVALRSARIMSRDAPRDAAAAPSSVHTAHSLLSQCPAPASGWSRTGLRRIQCRGGTSGLPKFMSEPCGLISTAAARIESERTADFGWWMRRAERPEWRRISYAYAPEILRHSCR